MQRSGEMKPGLSLLFIAVYVILGLVMFQAVAMGLAALFFDIPFAEINTFINDPLAYANGKQAMLMMQGVISFGTFILVPLFFYLAHDRKFPDFELKRATPVALILVSLIVLAFMMVNAWFIEFNASLSLPEALKGIEQWAREMESRAEALTSQITEMDSVGYFLAALVVVAVIPGIGEELLFRGIIQNKFRKLTGNIHVAIWISAAIFSAFHFQFFGFIPRMLLGAMFGYIYYWSGSLILAMVAHFIQNGFTLFMLYLYQTGAIQFDIEDTDTVPIYSVLIFTVISIFLLYQFRNYYFKQSKTVS